MANRNLHVLTRLLLALLLLPAPAVLAEILYQIPVEHNHTKGECQGNLIVRDDKVIFESRTNFSDSRVLEYGSIERIYVKHAHEFHVFFADREHGKHQKYVFKFRSDNPDNRAALDYILGRIGQRAPDNAPYEPTGSGEPIRFGVELDLNGSNCHGTLVLREDKIVFETSGAGICADRAFIKDWDALKEFRSVSSTEFLLVFYKYGPSSHDVTRLRFWSKGGPMPEEAYHLLMDRQREGRR